VGKPLGCAWCNSATQLVEYDVRLASHVLEPDNDWLKTHLFTGPSRRCLFGLDQRSSSCSATGYTSISPVMLVVDSRMKEWSLVTDVHGFPGISGWKQLVPGGTLTGAWEAIELARLPPSGMSGLHRHTRTNEIYFLLAGRGEYLIDGRAEPMPVGHLAVTAVGSVHGLRNIGREDLVWLVAEASACSVDVIAPPSFGETIVKQSVGPLDLERIGELNLLPYGVAPLRRTGVLRLSSGATWELNTDRGEVFGYLMEGAGFLVVNGVEFAVAAGTGITLTRGEKARLTVTEPARMFWVCSDVAEDPT
jgi:mannose-6-phosphate isomerase-like protein (cupin superfamily)